MRGLVLRQHGLDLLIAHHADRRREAVAAFVGAADARRRSAPRARRRAEAAAHRGWLHLIRIQRGDADDAHRHDQQRGQNLDDGEPAQRAGRQRSSRDVPPIRARMHGYPVAAA